MVIKQKTTAKSYPTGIAICLLSVSILFVSATGQTAQLERQLPKPASLAELQAAITALVDQKKFSPARWGLLIRTTDGATLFERDADKSFMPASNMKLYTTAAALDAFGPECKFKTSVYATKTPGKRGELRGDLILYGRGDPNLSPRFDGNDPEKYDELKPAPRITAIESLADQIKAAGIRIIHGDLVGDDSYFAGDLIGNSWEWDDLQFYYGAEISALTINDNAVTFTVTPGRRVGDKPVISVRPLTQYVQIVNNAKTVASGPTRIGVHRPLNSNRVEFFGTISLRAGEDDIDIAIHEPALYAATLLKESLERRGIKLMGRVRRIDAVARIEHPFDESKLTEIAQVQSQPMSEILKVINKESQNLHTEILLRQLGALRGETPGLDEYGRPRPTATLGNEVRRKFLEKAGADLQPLNLRDGSGMARQNLIAPRATMRILEFMLTHPNADAFRTSLPVAGLDGTLKRRMRNTAATNNLRAKTGTLTGVNALSGYLTTKRGQLVLVSMVGNNYTGPGRDVTTVLDDICVLLAEYEGLLP
jgi:D-alanyl-D-alanine carboxypeptidase/D-alanyl-D-alanine-endopeptidase (penicillin-binding protein 4)